MTPNIKRRTRLLLVVTVVAVALAFLMVTIMTQQGTREIDGRAYALETDAVPSVTHLTTSLGALRRVTLRLRDLARDPPSERPEALRAIAQARRQLDEEMRIYAALPAFAVERGKAQEAAKVLGVFERTVDAVIARVSAGDHRGAQDLMLELARESDRADAELEDLVQLNADEATAAIQAIREARLQGTRSSYLLHALGGALVLAVLLALWRACRAYERVVEERAQLETERKQFAERRADELDMFAARVAHDLKNPLAAMALRVSVAGEQQGSPDAVRTQLERTRRSIGSMQQIIDGLLAFARCAGARRDGTSAADLGEVLESALAAVSADVARVGATVSMEPFVPARLSCDPGALLSVVGNLLGNAVKYIVAAPPDARHIRVRVIDLGAKLRVAIDDTGPGIPSEELATIFDAYVRGANAMQPGVGLGLATVKRIVEAHRGTVGVLSVVGKGSSFWFELPRAAAEQGLARLH